MACRTGGGRRGGRGDHVAAAEVVDGDVAEVEGDAGAGGGLLAGAVADVEGAHAELAGGAVRAGGIQRVRLAVSARSRRR
jgi:hypothetical protein